MSAELDNLPKDDDGNPVSPSQVPPPQELLDLINASKCVPALAEEMSKERVHRKFAWVTRVGVVLMYVWKILEAIL